MNQIVIKIKLPSFVSSQVNSPKISTQLGVFANNPNDLMERPIG